MTVVFDQTGLGLYVSRGVEAQKVFRSALTQLNRKYPNFYPKEGLSEDWLHNDHCCSREVDLGDGIEHYFTVEFLPNSSFSTRYGIRDQAGPLDPPNPYTINYDHKATSSELLDLGVELGVVHSMKLLMSQVSDDDLGCAGNCEGRHGDRNPILVRLRDALGDLEKLIQSEIQRGTSGEQIC